MQVYLSVPLLRNRNKTLAKEIANLLRNMGHEVISDWILLDDPNPGLSVDSIFQRDYNALCSCNILVAEVSEPSTGVGMEIMLAFTLKKKIICIHNNEKISNLLKGLPNISILSYENISELKEKLLFSLRMSS